MHSCFHVAVFLADGLVPILINRSMYDQLIGVSGETLPSLVFFFPVQNWLAIAVLLLPRRADALAFVALSRPSPLRAACENARCLVSNGLVHGGPSSCHLQLKYRSPKRNGKGATGSYQETS
jgi:hypothetical protein